MLINEKAVTGKEKITKKNVLSYLFTIIMMALEANFIVCSLFTYYQYYNYDYATVSTVNVYGILHAIGLLGSWIYLIKDLKPLWYIHALIFILNIILQTYFLYS